MTHFKLFLLGPPQLEIDGEPVKLLGRKVWALLAFLALSGQPQSRDRLALLLWPEHSQSTARANLRRELSRLHSLLNHDDLLVEREQVRLRCDRTIWLDVAHFQACLDECRRHPHSLDEVCSDCLPLLEEAVALYRNDFLAGFTLPDSPEFDEWQFFEAESLRQTFAAALERLARAYFAQQQYAPAIGYTRRRLALDLLHEPAHRQLMELYALAGQWAAALRQYEECKRNLQKELNTAPAAETQSLYEAIRTKRFSVPDSTPFIGDHAKGGRDASGSHIARVPPGREVTGTAESLRFPQEKKDRHPALFVGRAREMEELTTALETARRGNGQILFVIGGAGRGKTTLVQEFARRAQKEDAELLVVSGSCNAYTGIGDPYLPFREILMALTGGVEMKWAAGDISTEPARRLGQAMPIILPALLEFAPDLISALLPLKGLQSRASTFAAPDAPWFQQLQTLSGGEQRLQLEERRLFTQVTELLKVVALQCPLLLILEDLHWVDAASNSLLFHLSRVLWDSRILLIGTYRPDELAVGRQMQRHPLASIVGELKRQYGDIWLDLGNLSPGEGRAFVDAYLDTQPNRLGEAFRAGIFRHTGGHALFTVELVRDLQERGELRRDEQGQWTAGDGFTWSTLPAKIGGVIEQRIGRLDDGLQAVLAVASVEGETFTAEVVARVQGVDEYMLVQRLSRELERQHRLVVGEGLQRVGQQRLSRYRFRHHLFQHYLYTRLTESERAYMHESIGRAMEALHAGATEAIAVQLAHHFEQAGLAEKAVVYLEQAGAKAHRLSANREAELHLKRALALLNSLPATPGRARQELSLCIILGRALIALKGLVSPEAGDMYVRAYELCQQVGDAQQLFAVLHGLFSSRASTFGSHRTIAAQMLQVAEKLSNPIYRVSAHHIMGNTEMLMGEFSSAQAHFEQSFALYEPQQYRDFLLFCGQDEGIACLANQCLNLWCLGYPDQALQRGQEGITLARPFAHPMSLSIPMHFVAWVHLMRGEVAAAHRQIDAIQQLANEQGFATLLEFATLYRGMALVQAGEVEAGIAQLEQLVERRRSKLGHANPVPFVWLARAYCENGEIERGLALLQEAQTEIDANDEHFWQAELYLTMGDLMLAKIKWATDSRTDLMAEVETYYLQAVDTARRQQAKSMELRAMITLCQLWQMQGKAAKAHAELAALYDWFTEGFGTADLLAANALLDALATELSLADSTA